MSSLITLAGAPATDLPLAGRVLMLDTSKQAKFQCYQFFVSRNAPIQEVPRNAMEAPLREALAKGILMDITGTDAAGGALSKVVGEINRAVKDKTMSLVAEGEEIGPKVIVGKDNEGNSYMITPKDEADYNRMQAEIAATGKLRIEKPKAAHPEKFAPMGFGRIYEEELPHFFKPGE